MTLENKESKASEHAPEATVPHQTSSPKENVQTRNIETNSSSDMKVTKKKKKSLFPCILMFLGRKMAQTKAR